MARKCFAVKRFLNVALLLVFCLVLSSPSLAAERIPANIELSSMSMLGHFDWIVNPDGTLTIEDIQRDNIQKRFQPLNINKIPHESGTVWLRFTLAERDPRTPPATLLLDMGEGIPATPTLYAPKYNMLSDTAEWQEYTPTQQSVFLMPEARSTPTTIYIRMEGMPGLWFSPTLRTPHNAATALERLAMPAVIVALAVVMLLCLLRGVTERGQWRVWSSLYTAVALFYAIWGIPPTAKGYIALNDMAVVLAPGVALILLSHVARHLMRSNVSSRIVDLQYVLLNLPGIIVALVPLIPGYAWTVRYLALWPLLTILFVPTTLGAWLSGLPGARRFLLGTLFPPIGAALALAGLQEPHFLPLPILETLPLWGVALGSLIIAGTTTPQEYNEEIKKVQKKKSQDDTQENALDLNLENTEPAENDLDDPNLRIVQIDEAQSKKAAASEHDKANANLEENLRWPVDQLLRDVAALESCALPAAVREHVTSLSSVVRDISHTLSAPTADRNPAQAMVMNEDIFELQSLLRQAHDSVSPLADSKNIALSWFMPPHLSQNYKGDAVHLLFVLRLLLESSVRATNRGAVQLAVRRVPESVNPGHLLFTVTDTGTGKPPQERSVSAIARAWELAASSHGFLGVESNAHGAAISFTLHCEVAVPEAKQAERKADEANPRIIIVSDNDANRQLWAFFLENLPYNVLEARNKKETLAQYVKGGAVLIIFDAEEATHILEQNIHELREYENNNQLEPTPCLAIYDEDVDWSELENIGFKHSLDTPITRSKLRNSITEILGGEDTEQQNEQVEEKSSELQSLELHSDEQQNDTVASNAMPTLAMPELYSTEQGESAEEIIDLNDKVESEGHAEQAEQEASEPENAVVEDSVVEDTGVEEVEPIEEALVNTETEDTDENIDEIENIAESPQEDEEISEDIEDAIEHDEENAENAEINAEEVENTIAENATDDVEDLVELLQNGENTSTEAEYDEEEIKKQLEEELEASQLKADNKEDTEVASEAELGSEEDPLLDDNASTQAQVESANEDVADSEVEIAKDDEAENLANNAGQEVEDAAELEVEELENATEELEGAPDMGNNLLLPGIDASQVKFAIASNDEDEAEQEDEDSYISPTRDRSNAAYLTSLIDTTVADDSPIANKVEAKEEERVEQESVKEEPAKQKPKISFGKPKLGQKKEKPAESVNASESTQAEVENVKDTESTDDTKAQETKAKPRIVFVKKSKNKPVAEQVADDADSINTKSESAVEEDNAANDLEQAPTLVFGESPSMVMQSVAIEFGSDKSDSSKPSVSDNLDSAASSSQVEAEQEQTAPLSLSLDSTDGEAKGSYATQDSSWVNESAPLSMHASSELTTAEPVEDTKVEQVSPTAFDDAPLSMDSSSLNDSPLSSNGVGEPMPVTKDGAKPEAPLSMPKLSSMAQKLEAKLAQKTGKRAEPMPSVQPAQARQSIENARPALEPVGASKPSIPSSPLQDLLTEIDTNLTEAKQSFAAGDTRGVAQFTARIASNAESFGLRTLGRLARTVEAAANAGDMDALHDLFPELEINIERNRIALQI